VVSSSPKVKLSRSVSSDIHAVWLNRNKRRAWTTAEGMVAWLFIWPHCSTHGGTIWFIPDKFRRQHWLRASVLHVMTQSQFHTKLTAFPPNIMPSKCVRYITGGTGRMLYHNASVHSPSPWHCDRLSYAQLPAHRCTDNV